uniref:SFRICE_017267 n=1 Tax=Spodoptera frugiperda TaxID=7108 RepID=A0A2H1WSA1_SPOFR
MLHESWPAAWHKSDSFELDALFAEVNNNCSKEGEAECGAEGSGGDAESPPPLPAFGYAHGALSPSHSRSYQELRPAAAHARDMQAYAHLEEVFKPGTPAAPGSTDGVYLRRSSPDLSPSPERRDDFRAHYEPYTPAPAPPAYSHDHHHHVDGYAADFARRLQHVTTVYTSRDISERKRSKKMETYKSDSSYPTTDP